MSHPPLRGLYPLLSDTLLAPEKFPDAAADLAQAGVAILQLRHKLLDDRARITVQRDVMTALSGWSGVLCINDRADLAALAHLDAPAGLQIALHLGQDDMPPAEARQIVGPDVLIGLSTHTIAQVTAAAALPVDYLGFGPVFDTTTKANPDATVGLDLLARATATADRPMVAIGGITAERARAVYGAGAAMVAIASDLLRDGVDQLGVRAQALVDMLENPA